MDTKTIAKAIEDCPQRWRHTLDGKIIGIMPLTLTERYSWELAMYKLGGKVVRIDSWQDEIFTEIIPYLDLIVSGIDYPSCKKPIIIATECSIWQKMALLYERLHDEEK